LNKEESGQKPISMSTNHLVPVTNLSLLKEKELPTIQIQNHCNLLESELVSLECWNMAKYGTEKQPAQLYTAFTATKRAIIKEYALTTS